MTIARLAGALGVGVGVLACAADPFVEVRDFGDNPGDLRMFEHVPTADVDGARRLVVFLHGCQQGHDAARTSGLVRLADERAFVVVAPEQGALNNGSRCFNWFEGGDTARDEGEAASIRAMVAHASEVHGIDADAAGSDDGRPQVFIMGLSAGGAMTASLLAAYPDVFVAGAVLAGGPAGCASSLADAGACMAGTVRHDADAWADLVRVASPGGDERAQWPRVLVVHGTADAVVNVANADALVAQWTALHGVDDTASATESLATSDLAATRETFRAPDASADRIRAPVERVLVDGLEHALPIDAARGCGEDAPFQRDIGLCAVELAASFFGL